VRAALAGLVAAGVALATTEVVATAIDRTRPSVIGAVASRLVVALSGPLKNLAIRWFGTNDKTALVAGIIVVGMSAGAGLGLVGRRHARVAIAGLAVFGVVGIVCADFDPLASAPQAAVASVLGVVAGVATLLALLRLAARPAGAAPSVHARTARRRFLATGGGLAVLAVAGPGLSTWFRSRLASVSASRRGTLPPARRTTAVPDGVDLAVDGLTPYVTSATALYRIDTATFVPRIDLDAWHLRITGMVEHPLTFTYDELLAMELVEEPVTIACVSNDVGGHLIGNGRWRGVPLATLLSRAGVDPAATQIVGRSVDDFTVGIPAAVAADGRVAMVALGLDGDVLPDEHGFPARLIVSGLYGYASATKWLTEIELNRIEDLDSYWVERGWARDGSIVIESRVDVPASGVTVPAGRVSIAGVAWAPPTGIAGVEVQIDRGAWRPAQLAAVASGNTWVQWSYAWTDAVPGQHLLAVRATDRLGRVQSGVDDDSAAGTERNGIPDQVLHDAPQHAGIGKYQQIPRHGVFNGSAGGIGDRQQRKPHRFHQRPQVK